MIGMPAANRIECTGRSPVDVPSMFNESIPTHATSAATRASAVAAERCGWSCMYCAVPKCTEWSVRTRTACPASPTKLVGGQVDRHDAAAVETDGRHIGDPLEREGGEIVTVRVPVERHVEIRAGVRAHRDEADVERGAWCVQVLGGFARQVCPDDGGGQPGIRLHPLGDPMAEIDQLCSGVRGSHAR